MLKDHTAIEHWNNIVKKIREAKMKLELQEKEQVKLLQETINFIEVCRRQLDYSGKIFFNESED